MRTPFILSILFISLLTACSISTIQSDIKVENTTLSNYIDPKWLSGNEEMISERIVSYIRTVHPVTDPEFPRLIINKIQVENTTKRPNEKDKAQKSLKRITDSVVKKLLPPNTTPNNRYVVLNIAIRKPKQSKTEKSLLYAYMVPAMGLCWGSAFIVCPIKETEVIVVELNVERGKKQNIVVQGIGASTLYQQTVLINDSSEGGFTGRHERNTKALVAAVADAVEKLIVKIGENKHP